MDVLLLQDLLPQPLLLDWEQSPEELAVSDLLGIRVVQEVAHELTVCEFLGWFGVDLPVVRLNKLLQAIWSKNT